MSSTADESDTKNPWRILIVGQTPPPVHGQGIMLERLIRSDMKSVELHHIRLAFSKSMDEVGRFKPAKVLHLLKVILQVYYCRIVHHVQVLYYPPAGPNRIPMWRDIVFLLATRWLFAKTIFHMHANGISTMHARLTGPSRWLFERAYYRPEAVIRMSEFTSEDGRGLQAVAEYIVPNCAEDESEIHATDRGSNPDGSSTLLYLGTVCETKGMLDLLEACRRLRESSVPFRLNVIGSFQPAAFESVVRQRIADHGLQDCVILHGQITGRDKSLALAAADIFCFPTYYESEGFPCVLLEAMSFGIPLVSTRWRGIQSIVDDGENGYLVAPRDIAALHQRLEELLQDDALRSRMGENGREKFLRHYTTQQHLAKMEAVFRSVRWPTSRPAGLENVDASSRCPTG